MSTERLGVDLAAVDVDLEAITAPAPFVGEDYVREVGSVAPPGFCWAVRADGHRKLVPSSPHADPLAAAPSEWDLL